MIPLIVGYSETHFRFGGISPSLLFKREPEIIVDMPARLAPHADLPIMILMNDVHRFPASLYSVELSILSSGRGIHSLTFLLPDEVEHPFSFRASLFHLTIPREELTPGWNTVHAKLIVEMNGRRKTVLNDNLRTASQRPFSVFVATTPFPNNGSALFGDMHTHSIHSNSHVEFGAPLTTVQRMGVASGMDFAAVTDHSYDLECKPENYLVRDESLENWEIQQECELGDEPFLLMRGEEISGRRKIGGVVHCGALGHQSFIHGSGDGARKGYNRSSEPSLQEAAAQVVAEGGITFAAHPGEKSSLFHRIMLRRGNWTTSELTENITAVQAINGRFDHFWYVARKLWVSALLSGKRIPLIAGNDAHGDFNRYRAIGFPFLYIKEDFQRYFALARTGVYETNRSQGALFDAIRAGATFITDGPFLSINRGGNSVVGCEVDRNDSLEIEAISSKEFGLIERVRIITGHCDLQDEKVWFPSIEELTFSQTIVIESAILENADYVRVELECAEGERLFPTKAVTSPVYLS